MSEAKRVLLGEYGDGVRHVLRCKNCKHWDAQPKAGGTWYQRELDEHPGMGVCDEITGGEGKLTDIYALQCDGGFYPFTAPDFGCVLFELKEAT